MFGTENSTDYELQNSTESSFGTWYTFNIWFSSLLVVSMAPVNVVIIYLLSQQRKTINTCGFTTFAISLAVTDTAVGIISIPFGLTKYVMKQWPFGGVSCLLFLILDFGLTSVSLLIMAAMGYDRYKCVTAPMIYRLNFNQRRVVLTSVITGILGIVSWVPGYTVVYVKGDPDPSSVACTVRNYGYLSIPYAVVMYLVPLVFTTITYAKLVLNLRERLRLKSINNRNRKITYIVPDNNTAVKLPGSFRGRNGDTHELERDRTVPSDAPSVPTRWSPTTVTSRRSQHLVEPHSSSIGTTPGLSGQNYRCLKTSILIVFSFVLCWGPVCLLWPVVQVCEECIDADVYHFVALLSYANSAMNPFIYLATSGQLRKDFKKLICRK